MVKKKNKSVKHSDQTLINMDEHIAYELQMFQELYRRRPSNSQDQVEMNMHVECRGIHTRALFDFFFCKTKVDTDVVAGHFFDNPNEWEGEKENMMPEDKGKIEHIRNRVNREIAHISTDRLNVRPEDKGWNEDFKLASEYVNNALIRFLQIVPERRLGEKLKDAKRRVLNSNISV
jgi:hypothetical protein